MVLSVLILGSGPSVVAAREWDRKGFDRVVVLNNAWQVRPDWDDLIYPYDFPAERRPKELKAHQKYVTQEDFVPIQNQYGGFVYAGGTMAFTAAYWVLGHYKPRHIAFLGCDMDYSGETTHFYGQGTADPLRDDITLMSLEAKANRFYAFALEQGCRVTNLSQERSRLTFPRQTFGGPEPAPFTLDPDKIAQARMTEKRLSYFVPSGRYWEEQERFDVAEIKALDALWLEAVHLNGTS